MNEDIKSYTTKEVAEMMHIREETVRDYINKGKLGAYMIGLEYRVTSKDLNNYMESNKKEVKG